jgi:hypothetical protein
MVPAAVARRRSTRRLWRSLRRDKHQGLAQGAGNILHRFHDTVVLVLVVQTWAASTLVLTEQAKRCLFKGPGVKRHPERKPEGEQVMEAPVTTMENGRLVKRSASSHCALIVSHPSSGLRSDNPTMSVIRSRAPSAKLWTFAAAAIREAGAE